MASLLSTSRREMTLFEKVRQVNLGLIFLLAIAASIGFVMLYSAAGGNLDPWASRQINRFGVGLVLLVGVAVIDQRLWFRFAYAFYGLALVLLVGVELEGRIGMGAQRWLVLGPIQIQPSELMKIAIVLTLARYFHTLTHEEIGNPLYLIWPTVLVLMPVGLIFKQPDLGSAMLVVMTAAVLFFLAGVRIWKFAVIAGAALAIIPIGWGFLRDYQKQRLLTFIDPEADPLGSGYHIMQSKIALGSGGMWGKGYLQGTQAHLQFLPEKQTDFIFTMLSEEFGFVGGLTLIAIYVVILIYGMAIALRSRNQFGRLVAMGLVTSFFIYAFINMAMVVGLLPVVGVPLPLVSYGGTSMMTLMIGFGLVVNAYVHRDLVISRGGGGEG